MADRRAARSSHVRPRPPSSGRPAPAKVRPRAPAPGRLAVRTPIRRSRGVPLVGRLFLVLAVAAIAVGVLYVGIGGLGTVARAVGSTVTGFVDDVLATPVPSVPPVVVSDAPSVVSPREPYTNVAQADLMVTVDPDIAGDPDYILRIYLALEGQAPAPIQDASLAPTAQTIIPVALTEGINDFAVTLIGPGGESESSPLVRYVLDQSAPAIKLASPADGATINGKAVDLTGRTQARSTLIARNTVTGESIGGLADTDGSFALKLPLVLGGNRIVIASTDPAGNVTELEVNVSRGSGQLSASLNLNVYRVAKSDLPRDVVLTATVRDPDGKPLAAAAVTFTLSIPGIQTITAEALTDANGVATFTTTIPAGGEIGGGSAAVLVQVGELPPASDQTPITITE